MVLRSITIKSKRQAFRFSASLLLAGICGLVLAQSSMTVSRSTSGAWPLANGPYSLNSTSIQSGNGHTNNSTYGTVTYTISVIAANGSPFPTSISLLGSESLTLSVNGNSSTPTSINPVTGKLSPSGSASSNSSAVGNNGPYYSSGAGNSAAPGGPASYIINVSNHTLTSIVIPSDNWSDQGNGTSKNTITFIINVNLSSTASVVTAGYGDGQAIASGADDGFTGATLS